MDYFIVTDTANGRGTLVRGFECARCLLPEQILDVPDFRYAIMDRVYHDYRQNVLAYELKWKTGEITSELLNHVRRELSDAVFAHIHVWTREQLNAGFIL